MGDLFTKYYRLQEKNRQLEGDTKTAVVSELLEVLDDLERTVGQLTEATPEHSAVRVVAEKMVAKLEGLGFTRLETVGKPFDPNVHEAVTRKSLEGFASEVVCEELRSGWSLGDRVVRAAVVAVAE